MQRNTIENSQKLTLFGSGGGVVFFAITQKVFELGSSNFLTFLTTHSYHLRLKAGLLNLLPEFSGILPKCLILPILD